MLNKMNYQETTDWMFNQLPMYQLQGASAYKDLTNTHLLESAIHIKSKMRSCCWYKWQGLLPYASIYTSEAGYKVGLYTSPHLKISGAH
jgi:dihydrofolate synthase/folylpolyglutamate synthase